MFQVEDWDRPALKDFFVRDGDVFRGSEMMMVGIIANGVVFGQ